jgi:hypothetical protein
MKINNSGYSIDIYFRDWNGGRNFGISSDEEDSVSLTAFRDFCWDAGRAYGFSENQMDSIFNLNFDNEN